jgi:hypothetical protein
MAFPSQHLSADVRARVEGSVGRMKWHRHASPFRVPAIRAREQADGVYFRPAMSQGAELVAGRGELQDACVHDNAWRGVDLHPLAG